MRSFFLCFLSRALLYLHTLGITGIHSTKRLAHTVDGRNPAPAVIYETIKSNERWTTFHINWFSQISGPSTVPPLKFDKWIPAKKMSSLKPKETNFPRHSIVSLSDTKDW